MNKLSNVIAPVLLASTLATAAGAEGHHVDAVNVEPELRITNTLYFDPYRERLNGSDVPEVVFAMQTMNTICEDPMEVTVDLCDAYNQAMTIGFEGPENVYFDTRHLDTTPADLIPAVADAASDVVLRILNAFNNEANEFRVECSEIDAGNPGAECYNLPISRNRGVAVVIPPMPA